MRSTTYDNSHKKNNLLSICSVTLITLIQIACTSIQPYQNNTQPIEEVEQSTQAEKDITPKDPRSLDELLLSTQQYDSIGASLPAEMALKMMPLAINAERWDIAEAVIKKTQPASMNANDFAKFSLHALNYWGKSQQHKKANDWLNSNIFLNKLPLMTIDYQTALSTARAENQYELGQYFASTQERIFLTDYLSDKKAELKNNQAIWQSLLKIESRNLKQHHAKNPSDSVKAWIELALIHQNLQQDVSTQAFQAQQWKQRWPKHPANKLPENPIKTLEYSAKKQATVIGVFLPFSGRLSKAGSAIRDGIAAAHFSSSDTLKERIKLKFYDTANQSIEYLYQQAIDSDVEIIIGPLEKENVKALFTMPTDIPILTLNFVPGDLPPPDNIFQFGLAAEDEAIQLAKLAHTQGYKNPLVLMSDKDWTNRAKDSFQQQWLQMGHPLPKTQLLSVNENFSAEIATSMALPNSEARLNDLQNATATRFEFTPRRRQDFDLIVLFANSRQAKAIKPLLAYHYAGKLPVFASSHIYNGEYDENNTDLNGVIFSEMPLLLNVGQPNTILPLNYKRNKNLGRLFAMGVDAFQLHKRLNQFSVDSNAEYSANTGRLSLKNHRVVRELPMAKIQAGKAVISKFHAKDS